MHPSAKRIYEAALILAGVSAQGDVATFAGVSAQTLKNWENRLTGVSRDGRLLLFKRHRIQPGWIEKGEGDMLAPQAVAATPSSLVTPGVASNVEDGPDLRGLVPLISWVQAGYGKTAVDNLHPGEGEKIETTYKARRHTYALRVKGDSMEPKFPQGCIVIVEPEEDPIHGKYVIVRRNGDEPTLKQYIEEGGNKFLKPVNPRYPIELMQPDDAFCGVVKRLEQDV